MENRSRGRDCQLDSLPRSRRTVMTTCRSEAASIHHCENTFKDEHKRDCGNGSLTNVTERMKKHLMEKKKEAARQHWCNLTAVADNGTIAEKMQTRI